MKKTMKSFTFCTFLLLAFLFISMQAQGADIVNTNPDKRQPAGPMALDFSLKDLSGKSHLLKNYRGKTVILNFTATWCPYCKKDIPYLKKLYSSMKGKEFELLSIYVSESPKRVAAFAAQYDLTYPILVDEDASVARNYGIRGVPTKVLVSKDGSIVCWQCTNITIDKKLQEFLKEK